VVSVSFTGFSGRAVVSAGLGVHWPIRFFQNAKGPDVPTLLDLSRFAVYLPSQQQRL